MTLSSYYLWLGSLFRHLYFSRIDVRGEPVSTRPTLFVVSHRNGAIDGFVTMKALGNTPSLISIQLLRQWVMRFFFTGIAVVREKDRQRYGLDPKTTKSPVIAGIEQIQQGGRLCIYPEGTSAWDYKPLPYHNGMAVISAKLKHHQVDFVVQPVGLFYSKPDGFRSRVSIIIGKAFTPVSTDIRNIQAELSQALDKVSVNCHSYEQFKQIQRYAWLACQQGQDFGEAFLSAQQTGIITNINQTHSLKSTWIKRLFIISFPLVVLGAKIAARGSDGRNNLSFFHLLGGGFAMIIQLFLMIILYFYTPIIAFLLTLIGIVAWVVYPEPTPIE